MNNICPECKQPTRHRDLCDDCVDKFMKELDRDLERFLRPTWYQRVAKIVRDLRPKALERGE